jgi:hypothetical protein
VQNAWHIQDTPAWQIKPRRCLGNPLPYVAEPSSQGVSAADEASQGSTRINLAGHGVSLRVENGALTIRNGFTHYPQNGADGGGEGIYVETFDAYRGGVDVKRDLSMADGAGETAA